MNDIKNQIDIVLVETSHPGNIGSVARAMKTMGLKNLILVNPKEFPSKEAFMLSGNAQDVIEQATVCLLYTSPSPRDKRQSRMPSSA